MNLPRGKLESTEEWEHTQPLNYLSRVDSDFSGVIRFFERGTAWNISFLLFENGILIGYYSIKGDNSLDDMLYQEIERFEVEKRSFTETEMRIAKDINVEYLLQQPVKLSEMVTELAEGEPKSSGFFPDESFVAEIKRAKKFREDFFNRRTEISAKQQ
ncbi:MAG: hypothetical protein HXS41_02035 [Theionarchaea archaeon]|nr:hypothetical protein [Theionarchaea archaeon]MBU7001319.1 hypothetical protein [Theionarchaea archaeon]MBU7019810.1 hypothetical protein [Theionarchaea archaeon]MBU7035151.1 hypothetical protein [Theionarchaea archaeon]